MDDVTSEIPGVRVRPVPDGSAKGLDRDANPARLGRQIAHKTNRLVRTLTRTLQVAAVCFGLGGCALPGVFNLSGFEGLAEIGKNVGRIAEAGAAAVRPLDQLGKSMDSVGEMAIELDRTLPFGRDGGMSRGDRETGAGAGASSAAPDRQTGIAAHEPRIQWTAKDASGPLPFPISYRYPGGEHRRIELVLNRDRFHLDRVFPGHVPAPGDDPRDPGRLDVRFFRVLRENLPDLGLYALETSAETANAHYHYFLREKDDRFRYLGRFANLAYDPAREVFEEPGRHGPGGHGRSAYRLHESRDLFVKVGEATTGKRWTCSLEVGPAGTIRGECLARGRFADSTEETRLRVGMGGYGLDAHVVLELTGKAEGHTVSVLCHGGYAEGESCPGNEEGRARLSPYGFFWEFGDSVDLPGICRDPVSGRDHLVFRGRTGGSKAGMRYLVFSFDPESRKLRLEHVRPEASYATGPAAAFAESGTCNWRESKEAEAAIEEAMSRLLVGDRRERPEEADSWTLPVREVPSHVARDMLLALSEGPARNFVTFRGGNYHSEKDRDAWRVVQVQTRGGNCEDTPGVTLVQDRRRDRWWSIYDTRFDCRRAYPLEDMVLTGDLLFARMCRTCRWDANPGLTDVVKVELTLPGDGDGKSVPVSRVARGETPALLADARRNHLRHEMIRAEIRGRGATLGGIR
ncbi:MAG: hypothetical protein OXE44_13815 [Nitrospinae bacterium]|nr:hypothetical protein [Nitrospinota bacterium]